MAAFCRRKMLLQWCGRFLAARKCSFDGARGCIAAKRGSARGAEDFLPQRNALPLVQRFFWRSQLPCRVAGHVGGTKRALARGAEPFFGGENRFFHLPGIFGKQRIDRPIVAQILESQNQPGTTRREFLRNPRRVGASSQAFPDGSNPERTSCRATVATRKCAKAWIAIHAASGHRHAVRGRLRHLTRFFLETGQFLILSTPLLWSGQRESAICQYQELTRF